jgi:hypothetical protein
MTVLKSLTCTTLPKVGANPVVDRRSVRSLWVVCDLCHHEAVMNVDRPHIGERHRGTAVPIRRHRLRRTARACPKRAPAAPNQDSGRRLRTRFWRALARHLEGVTLRISRRVAREGNQAVPIAANRDRRRRQRSQAEPAKAWSRKAGSRPEAGHDLKCAGDARDKSGVGRSCSATAREGDAAPGPCVKGPRGRRC